MVVSARMIAPPLNRWLVLLVALLLAVMALSPLATSRVRAQDAISVTMVTDTAGIGDQNFNDAVREGLARAETDFGISVTVLESLESADYAPNLRDGAENSDLTVGVGFLLTEDLVAVATDSPDKQFMLIDGVAVDADGNLLPNVASVTFREQEAGFLGGVIAGLMTQTDKIGILGGEDIPPVERYEVGFVAGVETVRGEEVEVVITYTDTFEDPLVGREQSLALYNDDVDIILPIAGATGTGTFDAAKEFGEGALVISADKDQSQLGADQQLCVLTKSLAAAVYAAVQGSVEGGFQGGVQDVGLKEEGVGLETPGDKVPEDVLAVVDQYRQAIIDGDFQVPATRDELEGFEPPDLGTPMAGTPAA